MLQSIEGNPRISLNRDKVRGEFVLSVDELSGQHIFACYQCGNCSSGYLDLRELPAVHCEMSERYRHTGCDGHTETDRSGRRDRSLRPRSDRS
jgi:hypothetical protein